MPLNQPKSSFVEYQNGPPPLFPRSSKPTKSDTDDVCIRVKNDVSSPVLPPMIQISPTNSNAACTDQIEILEGNLPEGSFRHKNLIDLPPRDINTKFNDKSTGVNEKIRLLEHPFNNTDLRGARPSPKVNKITKHPVFNAEPAEAKEDMELPAQMPTIPRPLKNVSRYSVLSHNLKKLSLNKETINKEQNNSEGIIQHLKLPTKKIPKPLPSLPIVKAKTNDVNPVDVYSNFESPEPSTESIYEEIKEIKMEDILTGLPRNKTDKRMNQHEFLTTANNSEFISGKENTTWMDPGHSNHLPANKPLDIRKPSCIQNFPDKEKWSPRLAFIIKDLREKEIEYITQLENALEISNKLEKEGILGLTYNNVFGFFQEIRSFHKEEFLVELNSSETPKQFALGFVKHYMKFDLYIKREWLFSSNVPDHESFAKYIITENKHLDPYINLTTQRLSDYARSLQYFRSVCEEEKDLDNRVAVDQAIKIVENVEDQIRKVQQFKQLFGKDSEGFKECGNVRLIEKFKISINGSFRKTLQVYLCENVVIFADTQKKDRYKCVDVISTSLAYCRVLKQKNKFEIGIRGRNTFNIATETQTVKAQWCKKLKQVINDGLYEDV